MFLSLYPDYGLSFHRQDVSQAHPPVPEVKALGRAWS